MSNITYMPVPANDGRRNPEDFLEDAPAFSADPQVPLVGPGAPQGQPHAQPFGPGYPPMAPGHLSATIGQSGDSMVDLRQLLHMLWRRKWTIVFTSVLFLVAAFFFLQRAVPRYVASAQVLIEEPQTGPLDFQRVFQAGGFDFQRNDTEAAILMSRELVRKLVLRDLEIDQMTLLAEIDESDREAWEQARRAADLQGVVADSGRLNLLENPYFNPYAKQRAEAALAELAKDDPSLRAPASLLDHLSGFDPRALLPEWVRLQLQQSKEAEEVVVPLTEGQQLALEVDAVIDNFLLGVGVTSSQNSRVLTVSYEYPSAYLAAVYANALSQEYVTDTITKKSERSAQDVGALRESLEVLKAEVEQAQRKLEAHRREVGYTDIKGQADLLGQQLAQLNADLIRARNERIEAQARFDQVQKLLENPDGGNTALSVLNNQLIQRLREQEAEVSRAFADLSTQLRGKHPRLINKKNELLDIRKKIDEEVAKIALNLGNELEIAEVRELSLFNAVTDLENQIKEQNENLVTLEALQADVEAQIAVRDSVLERFKELDLQGQQIQRADARLISMAVPPSSPSYPRKGLIMALALFASIAVGIVLVFILEQLDSGFRSMPQLEQVTGVPAIGIVPKLRSMGIRNQEPQDVIVEKPNSVYSEAIRTIRTSVLLSGPQAPKTVLFTSSMPAEGKTSVAASVARSSAKAGQRTIIVDCDMRHPSLHEAFDVPNIRGLAEYLGGECALEDVVDIDDRSGAHYISAGHHVPHPTDMLGSRRMLELIERLKATYDLVIFDTPPVLAVSDVMVLLRRVDKTVYLVRWGVTRREAVTAGVRQMLDGNADLAGLVLTQVDTRKHSGYGYGGYRYYYGANQRYYQS